MASATFYTRYRPVRIGLLVRDGHIEDLEKAAGLNTLLWGGMYNPFIPVHTGDNAFAKQLIDLFCIDILYVVAKADEIDALIQEYPFLQTREPYAHQMFYGDSYTKKNKIAYLDSLNIMDKYWQRDFKHKPTDYVSNCTFPAWQDDDPLKTLFALQFGRYPDEYDLEVDFEGAFRKKLRARELTLAPKDKVKRQLARSIFPIQLTGLDLQGYGGGYSHDGSGLYIGDETDFTDLLTFWNLRASGYAAIFFLPVNHLDRLMDFAKEQVEWLDELPHAHPNIDDHIAFHYIGDKKTYKDIADKFATKKRHLICHCDDVIWNGLNVKPRSFYFSRDTCVGSVEKPHDRYLATLSLPEKKFLPDTAQHINQQQLAISIEFFSEFEYPGYTLQPPYLRQLNEYYSREIAFQPEKLRVERQGVALLIDVHDAVERLYPIAQKDVLQKIFELAGITAKPSQPGLLATRIIEQLGGIEDGRVFKIAGVRKLIQDLPPYKPITRGNALQTIWDDGRFQEYEHLYIEPREHKSLRKDDVFDYLLKKDCFRAGLELVCDRCKLANWLSLRDLDDRWTCQYCGSEDRLSLHMRHRGDWKFRKSGLLAKDNNQEGAVPVILSLLTFKCFGSHLFPEVHATALSLSVPGRTCEVDFVVFRYGRKGQLEIAIGEAKGAGGVIDQKDIDNMRFVRDKLEAEQMACSLVFSKTAEAFTNEELDRFRRLRDDGVPAILLTNKELEPLHPYWGDEDEDRLPHKYAHTFSEIAQNSVVRYLNLPEDGKAA